jgi:hypothetical protein
LPILSLRRHSSPAKPVAFALPAHVKGVSYVGEYAEQQAHDSNPLDLDSRYYLAELGYTVKGVALKGGYEVLGGSNRPLITLPSRHRLQPSMPSRAGLTSS